MPVVKTTVYNVPNGSAERHEQIERILTPIQDSLTKKMDAAFSSEEEQKAARIAITVCMEAFREFMAFRMSRGEHY